MKVKGVVCLKHNIFIYSRAEHDFHICSGCIREASTFKEDKDLVAIDGGQKKNFISVTGNKESWKFYTMELPVTKKDLFYDWRDGLDRLGEIKLEEKEID